MKTEYDYTDVLLTINCKIHGKKHRLYFEPKPHMKLISHLSFCHCQRQSQVTIRPELINGSKKQPMVGSESGDEYRNTWVKIAGTLFRMQALDVACASVTSLPIVLHRPGCVTIPL